MEYKLVIDGTLPNLNDFISKLNVSKFRGAELKRNAEKQVTRAIKRQLRGLAIPCPVMVRFEWYEPDKKRDKDNIAFAKKFIFDALVSNKVLTNDGWAQIAGFSDFFAIDKQRPRVEVTISLSASKE